MENNNKKYICESCHNKNDQGGACCGEEMKEHNDKCDCGSGKNKSECCSD